MITCLNKNRDENLLVWEKYNQKKTKGDMTQNIADNYIPSDTEWRQN